MTSSIVSCRPATARNGMLFTREGRLMIRNARHARDPRPVDEACACYACRTSAVVRCATSRSRSEMLGAQLATLHNLHFYLRLMREIRADLAAGTFPARAARGRGSVGLA